MINKYKNTLFRQKLRKRFKAKVTLLKIKDLLTPFKLYDVITPYLGLTSYADYRIVYIPVIPNTKILNWTKRRSGKYIFNLTEAERYLSLFDIIIVEYGIIQGFRKMKGRTLKMDPWEYIYV